MSSAIGPGDWVECVDASLSGSASNIATAFDGPRLLTDGALYLVDWVGEGIGADWRVGACLTLTYPKAWDADGNECGWAVRRFRPISGDQRIAAPASCVRENA